MEAQERPVPSGSMTKRRHKRDGLIQEYREYVCHVVGYLINTMHLPRENFEEFVAAGNLGLVEAAERFNFDLGTSFKNYAFMRIRGAVIDSIRECSDLSGRAYKYSKAIQAIQEAGIVMHQDLEQISQERTNQSKRRVLSEIMQYAARGVVAHRLSMKDSHEELTTENTPRENAEVEFLAKENKKNIYTILATLPKKHRFIIEGYYFEDKSFVEIAKELGNVSKSWVSRIHAQALANISWQLSKTD